MYTSFIEYWGVLVRFIYINFYIKKRVNLIDLWKKTKYNENLEYLKWTNFRLGTLFTFFITLIIIIVLNSYDILQKL